MFLITGNSDKIYQTKLDERIAYNEKNIGTITYDIYLKDENNELTLIDTTPNTTYTYTVSGSGSYNFVVKSSYTIFKANASDGATITVDSSYTPDLVAINLIGESNVTKTIGTSYVDEGIRVTNNGVNVTSQASYIVAITDSNGSILESLPNNTVGTYTMKYTITYKGEVTTLNRTITYTE